MLMLRDSFPRLPLFTGRDAISNRVRAGAVLLNSADDSASSSRRRLARCRSQPHAELTLDYLVDAADVGRIEGLYEHGGANPSSKVDWK